MDHSAGTGLLFDVALGRWGDGYVRFADSMAHQSQTIPILNNEIWLQERDQTPRGIGVILRFDDFTPPGVVKIGNWYDEFAGRVSTGRIYDLALHARWDIILLSPGDTLMNGFVMASLLPDPLDEPFLRWNLPQSFTLEDNMLFPGQLETHVEIVNNNIKYNSLTLRIPETNFTFPWESSTPFNNLEDTGRIYQTARVRIPEIYDTTLIPVTLQLCNGDEIVDELERWVFIPATVFSNEGLDVHIDTAFFNYGKINLSFKTQKTATGQLINSLHKNNVILQTNDEKAGDFEMIKDTTGGLNKTDIVFVLDVTGSMSEEIAGVRDNIIEFADSLSYRGIDYRLGMVTFLDIIENVYDFTEDVQEFQMHVSEQYAHGGDDRAENSLDALSHACQLNFRDDAARIFIWITDADFHISDQITQETKESVINQLLAKGVQVFCIADPQFQTDFYDQIIMSTGGTFYDINGNFRDILLEVTRLHQSTNYLISFVPDAPLGDGDEIKVEVHYGGLGGADSILFSSVTHKKKSQQTKVEILPNPVTSETSLQVTLPEPCDLSITIYDIIGRSLATHRVRAAPGNFDLHLSEIIDIDKLQTNRIYLLQVRILSAPGGIHTCKIFKSANH
jgi:Mg-chelatase subunit ChlD